MRSAVILQLLLQALDIRIRLGFRSHIFRLIPQGIAFCDDACTGLLRPLHPRCCRRQCSVRHAQFGIGARLLGGGIGQGNFAFARLPLGVFRGAQKGRALLLLCFNLLDKLPALRLQPRERVCGIMRQLAFARAVVGHSRRLRRKVGLALDDPFVLAG